MKTKFTNNVETAIQRVNVNTIVMSNEELSGSCMRMEKGKQYSVNGYMDNGHGQYYAEYN